MTDSHAITTTAPAQIEQQTKMHPLAIAAMQNDIDPERLEKLMALQERHEAREAKKAYTESMALLKSELPAVLERDQKVDYVNRKGIRVTYTHTSAALAVSVIVPILSKYGFSHTWIPATEGGLVRVTCRITHRDGHSEEAHLESPPDTSGNKGPAQAIASTQTLLSRYTLLGLLGIATADMKEPRQSSDDKVDAAKNLQAVATLKQCDVTLEQACNHVGKDVRQWTLADLEKLRELVRANRKQPAAEPAKTATDESREIEQLRIEVIDKARVKWGDDALTSLDKLLQSNGTSFSEAGLDALNWAMEEME
jgi:hypothetical protein